MMNNFWSCSNQNSSEKKMSVSKGFEWERASGGDIRSLVECCIVRHVCRRKLLSLPETGLVFLALRCTLGNEDLDY